MGPSRIGTSARRALLCVGVMFFTVSSAEAQNRQVSLEPVPYVITLPVEIAEHLSAQAMSGNWADQVMNAGAKAATVVFYTPDEGPRAILMTVYLFPQDKFDAAQNPDEPPPFGRDVIRQNGMVLSVAGPQDTMFDPDTADGQNVIAANGLIYEPGNYARTP